MALFPALLMGTTQPATTPGPITLALANGTAYRTMLGAPVIDLTQSSGLALPEALGAVTPMGFPGGLGAVAVTPGNIVKVSPIVPTVYVAEVFMPLGPGSPKMLVEISTDANDAVVFDYSNPAQGMNVTVNGKQAFGIGGTSFPATTGSTLGLITPSTVFIFRTVAFRGSYPTTAPVGPVGSGTPTARLAPGVSRVSLYDLSTLIAKGQGATALDEVEVDPALFSAIGGNAYVFDQFLTVGMGKTPTYMFNAQAVQDGQRSLVAGSAALNAGQSIESALVFMPAPLPPAIPLGTPAPLGAASYRGVMSVINNGSPTTPTVSAWSGTPPSSGLGRVLSRYAVQ